MIHISGEGIMEDTTPTSQIHKGLFVKLSRRAHFAISVVFAKHSEEKVFERGALQVVSK